VGLAAGVAGSLASGAGVGRSGSAEWLGGDVHGRGARLIESQAFSGGLLFNEKSICKSFHCPLPWKQPWGKKKGTLLCGGAVALGWCSASAATPSPRAVAVGNLRVCLVRVAVEPGSNLRAWLTWDRLSACNVLCLISYIYSTWVRKNVVWLAVRRYVAWD
jgi:hypothetical protein